VAAGDGAEAGAEAEPLDTDLQRSAMALKKMLQERFQPEGTLKSFFELKKLASCEFLPARAYRSGFAEAVEEEFDFEEGEAHIAGETDEQDAMKGVWGVAALAAESVGRWEQAAFFVVADGGSVEIGGAGELADFHEFSSLVFTLVRCISCWVNPERLRSFSPALRGLAQDDNRLVKAVSEALDLKLTLSSSIRGWDVANPKLEKSNDK